MSYDISLVKEIEVTVVGNQTYNTTPMFSKCIGHRLRDFDGQNAGEVAPKLLEGILNMTESPDIYRAMNPENGWGSFDGALHYLATFYKACIENPDTIVRVY